jgi:hypothetical protein
MNLRRLRARNIGPSSFRTDRPDASFRGFLPRWTTEDGFASILYIRNVQMVNAVRVRLSLILKHRTIILAEKEIDAAQTISVDVSQELIANSERAEQEGGAVIDYTANSAGGVNAWGQVVNETRSLSFSFSFLPDGSRHGGPLDAVAWYFDRDTDAFVSLQNTTDDFVRVKPTVLLTDSRAQLEQRTTAGFFM